MHRIDTPSATVDGKFTEGSPAGGVPATTVAASWLNDVQEELMSILAAAGITPIKGQQDQVLQAIIKLSVGVGAVAAFATSTAPSGWLKANGAAVSRTTYSVLFAAIGTTFGAGNGTTTFNLPDLRGEFIRGLDDGRGVDAGRALGSAQADEFKSHTHTQNISTTTTAGSQLPSPAALAGPQLGGSTSASGGAETRPRNVALLFCIKF